MAERKEPTPVDPNQTKPAPPPAPPAKRLDLRDGKPSYEELDAFYTDAVGIIARIQRKSEELEQQVGRLIVERDALQERLDTAEREAAVARSSVAPVLSVTPREEIVARLAGDVFTHANMPIPAGWCPDPDFDTPKEERAIAWAVRIARGIVAEVERTENTNTPTAAEDDGFVDAVAREVASYTAAERRRFDRFFADYRNSHNVERIERDGGK